MDNTGKNFNRKGRKNSDSWSGVRAKGCRCFYLILLIIIIYNNIFYIKGYLSYHIK